MNSALHNINAIPSLWYPPAETRIPLSAFAGILRGNVPNARDALRSYIGSKDCLLGPSGKTLLYLLLQGLAQKSDTKRNQVLIPGYTCYSVAAAAVKAGLKLRFYDINPKTFQPDIASLKENIGDQTLAVISQHLLGLPTDTHAIEKMATEAGAWHIEDAAQALGGTIAGRRIGTFGDFGLFSFGRGKPLPIGRGGALVSNRLNLNAFVPSALSTAGWKPLLVSLLTQAASHPRLYGISEKLPLGLGKTIFDPAFAPGQTPKILSGLVAPMLARLEAINQHRRRIAAVYNNLIHSSRLVPHTSNSMPVYPRYPVLAKAGTIPSSLHRLGARRLYPNALDREPLIAAHAARPQKLPGAEELALNLITFPTHQAIDDNTAEYIVYRTKQWL